jgi:hypothetical protein
MNRRTPLWVRGTISPDFVNDPSRGCHTPTGRPNNLFFDDSIEALAACQAICVTCPVFRDCTRWTLANYQDLPFGIFAGLSEHVRARIHAGTEQYYDWRRDWNRRYYSGRKAQAAQRRLLRSGEGKRRRSKDTMPPCPHCGQTDHVCLNGRSINAKRPDRQRHRCTDCKKNFLGGEL